MVWMKWVVCVVGLLCVGMVHAGRDLLVVGNVGETSARVLADLDKEAILRLYRVHQGHGLELVEEFPQHLPPTRGKQAGHLVAVNGLDPNTHYVIAFLHHPEEDVLKAEAVDFVTFGRDTCRNTLLSFSSCDQSTDDRNESFLKGYMSVADGLVEVDIGEEESEVEEGVARMAIRGPPAVGAKFGLGDQVYADQAVWKVVEQQRVGNAALETFRRRYRDTLGGLETRRKWYRRGGLWVIPDDHDIINDLGRHHVHTRWFIKPVVAMGRQVWDEYQGRLQHPTPTLPDISWNINSSSIPPNTPSASRIAHFATSVCGVGVLGVDLRFESTFELLEGQISPQQLGEHIQKLQTWHLDPSIHSIVIATSTPLLIVDRHLGNPNIGTDRYPTHSSNVASTIALLEAGFATPKLSLLVGGDMHSSVISNVCRNHRGDIVSNPSNISRGDTPWTEQDPYKSIIQYLESHLPFPLSTIFEPFGTEEKEWEEAWILLANSIGGKVGLEIRRQLEASKTTQGEKLSLKEIGDQLRAVLLLHIQSSDGTELEKKECVAQIVASGMSDAASPLHGRWLIPTAFGLLNAITTPYAGPFSGRIHSLYGFNNAVLLSPSNSTTNPYLNHSLPSAPSYQWGSYGVVQVAHRVDNHTSIQPEPIASPGNSVVCDATSVGTITAFVCKRLLPDHLIAKQMLIDWMPILLPTTLLLSFLLTLLLCQKATLTCYTSCCTTSTKPKQE